MSLMETYSRHDDEDADDVIPSPRLRRRASLTGEQSDLDLLAQWQEETLFPLKEDLAEWLSKTLDIDIGVDNFIESLDSGVYVCKLASIIHQRAQQAHREDPTLTGELPNVAPRCKNNARSGTWFARDNIANFLTWCRNMKVREEYMFETEGLAMHREPRSVVLCLLELARIGYRYGMEPPSLIRMEREIEKEEALETSSVTSSSDRSTSSSPRSTPRPFLRSPPAISHRSSPAQYATQRSAPAVLTRPSSASKIPRRRSLSAQSDDLEKAMLAFSTPCMLKTASGSGSDDEAGAPPAKKVRKVEKKCKCPDCFVIERLSEGKYKIGGRTMFVRLLKGRHVMVRVGGGWDTLDHYLATHDPCKVNECSRSRSSVSYTGSSVNQHNMKSTDADKFLFMRSRYTGPCKKTGRSTSVSS